MICYKLLSICPMIKTILSCGSILNLRRDGESLGVQEVEWRRLLDSAETDAVVGIRHVEVSGTEFRRLHVALIPVRVGCHFHRVGDEEYSVVQGRGTMHFGLVDESEGQPEVNEWLSLEVQEGDTFTIPQQYAHQLTSSTSEELVIVFACPDSHLDDRDRTMLPDAPSIGNCA